MTEGGNQGIEGVEVVLPCDELEPTLAFFTERLGFSVSTIFPADDPAVAVLIGYGARLRLQRGHRGAPGTLRLLCAHPEAIAGGETMLTAPNGTRLELVHPRAPLVLPPLRPSFVVERRNEARWVAGRAGMRYRDLVPDRQGGRFIASHISIPDGGPVPDYVHYHIVRFQMIYCYRGWVRVVYEDQGPPFVLQAGDCVLQPPRIRHRVLESSPGLEVVEIGCPAEHETHADHALDLPTSTVRPDRDFDGQRFVRHQAAAATWHPASRHGFEARDTGIATATNGLADVRILRATTTEPSPAAAHHDDLMFLFVLDGQLDLQCADQPRHELHPGDATVIPPSTTHVVTARSHPLQLLEVRITRPARER